MFDITRRVSLLIDEQLFDYWTRVSIIRDMSEISASFEVELRDGARNLSSWPYASVTGPDSPFVICKPVTVLIDNELVLIGYVDEVHPKAGENGTSVTLSGRDKTGDLADCAASVKGPTEFKGLTLDKIAQKICDPFGIEVRAEADVGDPFDKFSIDVGETALSAIEKGARQRALLVMSDGIGGLILTQSGKTRAPADLIFPGNIIESSGSFSAKDRFSDYYVKGQVSNGGAKSRGKAGLDVTAQPLGADAPTPKPDPKRENRSVSSYGHAKDEEITRFRPSVSQVRTQAKSKDAQTQADWQARTAKSKGEKLEYPVRDWRMNGTLWRPNQLCFVDDAFQDINRDMLIDGVTFDYDGNANRTNLRLTGPYAYDLQEEGERKKNKKSKGKGKSNGKSGGGLDGTAHAL